MSKKTLIKTLSLFTVFTVFAAIDTSAGSLNRNGALNEVKVWPSDESFLKQQDSLIQVEIKEASNAMGIARAYLTAPRDTGIENIEQLQLDALNAASKAVLETNKSLNSIGCRILGKLTDETCRSSNIRGMEALKAIAHQEAFTQALALMPNLAQNLDNYENQIQSLARVAVGR